MSEVVIIQMSRLELAELIQEKIRDAVSALQPVPHPAEPIKGGSHITVTEMCREMRISRTRFEAYKDDLIKAGMFKLGPRNSSYLMKRSDFEKWLLIKQTDKRV